VERTSRACRAVIKGLVVAFACSALAASAANGSGVDAASCGKLLPPASGAYFGALTDFPNEDEVQTYLINRFERLAGRKLVWAYFAQHWYVSLDFPRETVLAVWRNGQIPFIRFNPQSAPPQTYPEQTYTLQRIIDGRFDTQLRKWADAARGTNIPLLMEFGTELNDTWGPWNATWNGAGQTDGYGDPNYPDGAERFGTPSATSLISSVKKGRRM